MLSFFIRSHPWRSPLGQCFALLKIVPDDFLFAAIHGAPPWANASHC